MKKLFDIWPIIKKEKLGEYLLGADETGSERFAVAFGALREREVNRPLACPEGKLAFFYLVEGAVRIVEGKDAWTMVEGEAMLLEPEKEYLATNPRARQSSYLVFFVDASLKNNLSGEAIWP